MDLHNSAVLGFKILMRESYQDARANSQLTRLDDGSEAFLMQLPKGKGQLHCCRLPDGEFRVQLESLHKITAPEMPWEHFEATAEQLIKNHH